MTKITNYKFSKYYIYYKLADKNDKLRIITNDGKLDTIDKYENDYTDYNDIELKHIKKDSSDNVLKEYLIDFEIWKEECFKNGIYKLDITQGDIYAYQQCFFYLVQNYKDKKTKEFLHTIILMQQNTYYLRNVQIMQCYIFWKIILK